MTFAANISKFVEKTKVKPDIIVRKVAFDCLAGVILKSPVDTGRFRGNWRVAIGVADLTFKKDLFDKQGDGTLAKGKLKIDEAKFGNNIFLTNNVPYAEALENGHSKQAPSGVLHVTANDVFGHFLAVVKAVNDAP